jgi:hypothetical protein
MKKSDYSGPKCGYFKNVMSEEAIGKNWPLMAVLAEFKSERWRQAIEAIRAVRSEGLDEEAREAKEKAFKRELPGFMMSATTKEGRHKKKDCDTHTEVVQIDVDHIGNNDAIALRDRLASDPHVLAAWISPRGDGVKIAVRVTATVHTHAGAWREAADYIGSKYSVPVDPQTKALCALCFVGWDPEMILKEFDDVVPLSTTQSNLHSNSATQVTQQTQVTQRHSCNGGWGGFDVSPFVVTDRGQSNRRLFQMARRLKTCEKQKGICSTWEDRNSIFSRWWHCSREHVDPSMDAAAFLGKWEQAYNNARFADDESPVDYAWALALSQPLPLEAQEQGVIPAAVTDPEPIRRLIALCWHLSDLQSRDAFYLDCRKAGKLLAVHYTTAHGWLTLLSLPSNPHRILEKLRSGSRVARRANEWRFLHRPNNPTLTA